MPPSRNMSTKEIRGNHNSSVLGRIKGLVPGVLIYLLYVSIGSPLTMAQGYLSATGTPTFSTALPVEMGFVNAGNGSLHLEIPIASFPQRGSRNLVASLIYDSRIWQVVQGISGTWQPINSPGTWGGWRLVTSADPGKVSMVIGTSTCDSPFGYTSSYTIYSAFQWTASDGTSHSFNIFTISDPDQCLGPSQPSGDNFATDSTGYHMYVTNYSDATVFAPDGTQVYPTVKDANGNYFSQDSSGDIIDTLGRTPIRVVRNCNGNSNQTCYDILNSQGGTSRVTVTTTPVSVRTAFGQPGATEYSGTITVIQSIQLPDSSTYQLSYDSGTASGHYGLLTGMTLPTGGQVTYAHAVYQDAFGNRNEWVSSYSAGGGNWNYSPQVISTCPPGNVNCQQSLTVTKPSTDQAVYTFTLNNGAWNSQLLTYNGPSSQNNLISTSTITWDFSNPCQITPCTGAGNVRVQRTITTLPLPGGASASRKTEMSYVDVNTQNISSVKEWLFYAGAFPTNPDRENDFTYASLANANIVNRPLTAAVKNSAGVQIAFTQYAYDGSSLSLVTGKSNHDDAYNTSVTSRGNLTQLSRWVGGSNYLTTTFSYDTTGQIISSKDAALNQTTYGYSDSFFTDNGANPPQSYTPSVPTNAMQTQITAPLIGTATYGYYFGTGKRAFSRDPNSADLYYHYLDLKDRLTHLYYPATSAGRGWVLYGYTSPTQIDYYGSIDDASPSAGCSSCRHDRESVDSFGRPTTKFLVSDPSGASRMDTTFDSNGRVSTVSNPYRTTSDPTYGYDSLIYDGVDRILKTTHSDGSVAWNYYGPAVAANGGNSSQLCSSATYGLGFPLLKIDEAGKKKQSWIDGFGRMIETDEPDSSSALSIATCVSYDLLNDQTTIAQGSQTRSYTYDAISRTLSNTTPEAGQTILQYTNSSGALCSGAENAVCIRRDASGVTITYSYDALNRLVSKTYSDGSPTVTFFYDQTAFNGLTITYGKGRRTGMSDASGSTAWSYDALGHVIAERRTISGISKTTSYIYNLAGLVKSITYPSARTVNYGYNTAKQQISAVDGATGSNYAASALYAPMGLLQSVIHANVAGGFAGLTENYTFNQRLDLARILVTSPTATLLDVTYGFSGGANNGAASQEANGRDGNRSQVWTYDSLNRLSSAQTQATSGPACWGLSFGYDRWANLLTETVTKCSAFPLSVGVDNSNRITNSGFLYDTKGRLTSDGSFSYTYDAENQLTSAAGVNYTYDGDGLRVKKSNGKIYWRDTAGVDLAESDLNGATTAEYIYFAGRLIASLNGSASVKYLFADRVGSNRVATQSDGTVCFDADYYPFGGEIDFVSSCAPTFKFAGYERDTESGLDYAVRRFYSSRIGRFLTPDPINGSPENPQRLNRYSYVLNDPTNLVDSDGLYPQDQHQFITFILASLLGRSDAEQIASGAGDADNFHNATTGLFGLGAFINFSKHFGLPCTMTGNGCSSGGYQLGFDIHLVEDMSPGGPHNIVPGYGRASRVIDEIAHIFLSLVKNPDRDPNASGGFRGAWAALGGNPNSYPQNAIEFIRNLLNAGHLEIIGVQYVKPDGSVTGTGFTSIEGATLVGSISQGGVTFNVYRIGPAYQDDPNVLAIQAEFSLPGSSDMAEALALYDYQLTSAGFTPGSWLSDDASFFGAGGQPVPQVLQPQLPW